MTLKTPLLAAACLLALAACNRTPTETAEPAAPAAEAPAATAPAGPAPAAETPAAPAAAAPNGKPAATVADCATTIAGDDNMQYDVGSIVVPASCASFTINLKHVGKLPVTAMGHNVVVSKEADMQGIAADGMGAGAAADYVKPGDARVVAHTKLVGGGGSASVTFDTARIKDGGPYMFFCSFPGHMAMMKGTIAVQ